MDMLRGLDWGTHYFFSTHRLPWMQAAQLDLAVLGDLTVLGLVTALTVVLLGVLRSFRLALVLFVMTTAGLALAQAVPLLLERERPEPIADWLNAPGAPAIFPTRDGLPAAVVYLTLALVVAPLVPRRSGRVFLIATGITLAFVTGVSRLTLGTQFVTDLFRAWIGGLAWALVCREIAWRWLAVPPGPAGEGSAQAPS